MEEHSTDLAELEREVEDRLGLLPHLFRSTSAAPEVVQQLWSFAKAAYLDNPLPALFKERLFTYLSRFCEARYSVARHAAYLAGRGHPAGNSLAPKQGLEQIVALLRRPVPGGAELERAVSQLAALPAPFAAWPQPETREEDLVLTASTALFLEPGRSAPTRTALHDALGPGRFERLLQLLSYVRAEHYWTLMHPELPLEADVEALLREHEPLARLVLEDPEAGRSDMGPRLFGELVRLREIASLTDAANELTQPPQRLETLHHPKDSFLAVVSHELRNPVSAIRTAAEVLAILPIQDERLQQVSRILTRQTAAVSRIVDDLVDISRVSLDKLSIEREPLDLHELVEHGIADHRAAFDAAGLVLDVQMPDAPLRVRADRLRAAQIVENLLSNALRFTHAPGQVTVTVRSGDGKASVEVSDTGEGFDAEQAKLLFLPFVQASDTARDGLGLGLALSRRIAELHGGTLVGTSPGPHRGARFVWTLDLDTEQAARRAAQAGRTTRPADPKRILIVEDNRDAADALQQLLHLAGYDARLAYDAASAFEQLRLSVPDVVLCDLNLEGSADGLELARACRRDPRLDLVRLIAVSGYTSLMDVGAAREAGFEQFIAKPLSLEKIRTALASAAEPWGERRSSAN